MIVLHLQAKAVTED